MSLSEISSFVNTLRLINEDVHYNVLIEYMIEVE